MPTMAIEYNTALAAKESYAALFNTTGWNAEYQLDADQLYESISRSWFVIAAYAGERLVGFGRLISDGMNHAFLVDLIVLPEYQGQGIGSNLVQRVLDHCAAYQMRDIQLFSAKGKAGFYRKFGFVERPPDAPGMQIRRKM